MVLLWKKKGIPNLNIWQHLKVCERRRGDDEFGDVCDVGE